MPSEVMSWAEDGAELVVADLADEGAAAAERGQRGDGVGRGAPGYLDRRAHPAVEPGRRLGIDQRHGAAVEPKLLDDRVVGMGDDVDDGIADAYDIMVDRRHRRAPLHGF